MFILHSKIVQVFHEYLFKNNHKVIYFMKMEDMIT
jgi:hypothetical protein